MARPTSGGYGSISSFKRAHGTRPNYEWHHIVEQGQVGRLVGGKTLTARQVHHARNLVNIPTAIHRKCVTSAMASRSSLSRTYGNYVIPPGTVMRTYVHKQSYERQHAIGVALLRACGVMI